MTDVQQFHNKVDSIIKKAETTAPVKCCCRAGCCACCEEPVYSTHAEIEHILESLTYHEKAELKIQLRDWLERTKEIRKVDMPHALTYRALRIPCPFLKNSMCSIYSRRPMGCREFMAIGNPADCELPARAHQKFFKFGEDGLDLYRRTGPPPMKIKNGKVVTDHLAVLLAEKLFGEEFESASRKSYAVPFNANTAEYFQAKLKPTK